MSLQPALPNIACQFILLNGSENLRYLGICAQGELCLRCELADDAAGHTVNHSNHATVLVSILL